ncbi:UDP-N-acetylglucosamine 2-epimerase (non-hydrolyzing) [Lachnospiraceae bacterium]|nr:UDP-N-acetylglucosamine 2-epimerase (non-hydrolyzing) [Lachnospiraceae bacterium]
MEKLKLMTIVGTRPELIRLSEIIKKADAYFEHTFVHTGQNYNARLNDIFYKDLGIRRPDHYLGVAGNDLGMTIGNIIAKSYTLMQIIKPDALLILGDTNSALAAISAKRLKIPIFHMEAGNRCFDENLPEETNRRIVDHISDVNLPYTEHARRYLMAEGIRKEYIYVTGSPMKEVIMAHRKEINSSKVLEKLELKKKKYIVLSAHREENIDQKQHFESLMYAVNVMAETYQMPVIYSLHPRSEKYIKERNFQFHSLVKIMPPFNFTDYSALMQNAYCVVSDSGTIPEETAVSRFPAVCIRTSTERPEALDRGCFVIGGISEESLLQSVDMAVKLTEQGELGEKVPDYEIEKVSSIVIRIIQSYTRVIDDRIWRKQG